MTPGCFEDAGWCLLPEVPLSPAMNSALDEVLLKEVADGRRPPTLRFWAWAEPAVIIGRFQSLRNEVDLDAAEEMNVTVVRRISGGGAMFVQPNWTITYSLYFPQRFVEGLSIVDSYAAADAWVVDGIRELGAEAHYAPLNDIACSEGKIGGAAQVRRHDTVLHHTTIAYEMHAHEMVKVLRIGREKLSDKGTASAAKRVSPLSRHVSQSRDDVVQHLLAGFRKRFGLTLSELTAEEYSLAERLVHEKFANPKWTSILE
jgi:lipoate-protein ligase A